MVVTVKKTSWGESNKFEDIAFENTKTFGGRSSLFHSMIADGKKFFLKRLRYYQHFKLAEKLFSKTFFLEPYLARRTLKSRFIFMIKFLTKATLVFVVL